MPVDKRTEPAPPASSPPPESPAAASRRLLRTALKAALATLEEGHPYASLVLVATEADGAPVLLISRLAVHTRNVEKDPRVTLLFDGTGDEADPLSGPRVTVRGTLRKTDKPQALRRFLARHPSAEAYAGFADFSTYTMDVTGAHYIGGFGRIVDIPPTDILTATEAAQSLLDAEPEILAHMGGRPRGRRAALCPACRPDRRRLAHDRHRPRGAGPGPGPARGAAAVRYSAQVTRRCAPRPRGIGSTRPYRGRVTGVSPP